MLTLQFVDALGGTDSLVKSENKLDYPKSEYENIRQG
jgi:hypothetical protein